MLNWICCMLDFHTVTCNLLRFGKSFMMPMISMWYLPSYFKDILNYPLSNWQEYCQKCSNDVEMLVLWPNKALSKCRDWWILWFVQRLKKKLRSIRFWKSRNILALNSRFLDSKKDTLIFSDSICDARCSA